MNIQLDNTSVIDVGGYRDDTTRHGCVFVSYVCCIMCKLCMCVCVDQMGVTDACHFCTYLLSVVSAS